MEMVTVIRPTVTWVKVEGGSMILPETTNETTPTTTVLTLPFSPLTFSHRGVYRCVVDLNISMITSFHIEEEYNITVQCEYPPHEEYLTPDITNGPVLSSSSSCGVGST